MKIFVGKKQNPTFLFEINKSVSIYTPDKYSKNEEFYEKYSLGKLIDLNCIDIIFTERPVSYEKVKGSFICSQLIIKTAEKYILVTDKLKKLESIEV